MMSSQVFSLMCFLLIATTGILKFAASPVSPGKEMLTT